MKSACIITTLLLLSTTSLYAQLEANDLFIEADFSVNAVSRDFLVNTGSGSTTSSSETTRITMIPKIEYFITKNRSLLFGAGISYYNFTGEQFISSNLDFEDVSQSNTSFVLTAGIRFYNRISDRIYFQTSVNSIAGFGENESDFTSSTFIDGAKTFDLGLNLGLGGSFFLSENFRISISALPIAFFYESQRLEEADIELNTTSFNANLTSGLSLGMALKF